MASKVMIIHAKDFLSVTGEGTLDFEGSKKALREIAAAAGSLSDYEVLLDTRKAQSQLSTIDLWYLAAELASLGTAFGRKTAVLCPQERFDDAGFFAMCAQNRGLQVRGFSSFEDAIKWLTETQEFPPAPATSP